MSWRPKDWSNPYRYTIDVLHFEQGADAMLEALKQTGVYLPANKLDEVTEAMTLKLFDEAIAKKILQETLHPAGGWIVKISEEKNNG